MPKGINLKGFGRRKSSGNALEFESDNRESVAPPQQSSFRVLDRTADPRPSYGGKKVSSSGRTFNSPLNALRGKSVDDLGLSQNRSVDSTRNQRSSAWPLNGTRGSGGTTNSGSSGYYDSSSTSARHSSTSTLPSSLDQEAHEEELFPHPRKSVATGMYKTVAANADETPPPPPPSFSSRAARAFSFGGNRHTKSPSKDVPPLPPPHSSGNDGPISPQRSHSPHRERAMTTSSYASTAVPSKIELPLTSGGFGDDDFSSMFDSLKKDPQSSPPPLPAVSNFNRNDTEPMFPPRTLSRNALSSSPNPLKLTRSDSNSPYSWDDGSSNDGLVSGSALSSPSLPDGGHSPAIGSGLAQTFMGSGGYSRVPDRYASPSMDDHSYPERTSSTTNISKQKQPAYPSRQAQIDDEDRWVRKVELRDGPAPSLSTSASTSKLSTSSNSTARPSAGPSRMGAASPNSSTGDYLESNTTTPRAARGLNTLSEDSLFDSSPAGPASRAIRPTVNHLRTDSGGIKKMTKAQFEARKRRDESSAEQSEEEDGSEDDYDEEDEIEAAKKLASQRRKQEANMSVYRQQMKKVTGGGPTDLPSSGTTIRPSADRAASTSSLGGGGIHLGGIGGQPPEAAIRGKVDEDDDDDVPLGILQAHGFPSASRPPTRAGENNDMHQRRASVASSAIMNGGAGQGPLPAFARRLPADPYFGAGLVNQSTRESLALNGSAASVMGMPPSQPQMMPQQMPGGGMGHPGGLVGVIAGEEKARAARRGSPSAAVMMGQGMPLPSNMMPQMPPRTMSMANLAPPSVYNPSGMPPMPQMQQMGQMGMGMMQMPQGVDPGQQQMQQFMQMQMQLMQNMLNMQQAQMGVGGQTPQAQQQPGDYLGMGFNGNNRPMSIASQHSNNFQPPNQGRSMTMVNPPTGWGSAANPGGPRPNSAMPMGGGGYAPSVHGLQVNGGGAGTGYAPSIAPSERSNIGMPSRYRPVTQNGEVSSRTHSMTSSHTLQAFTRQQSSTNLPGTPFSGAAPQAPTSTIRVVDKPKGAPKVSSRPIHEDEDEGWADMKKKREDKKKSKWSFRKDKNSSNATNEPGLNDLYQTMD